MDSAMRDIDRIQERGNQDDGGGRRVSLMAIAAVVTLALVLALCLQAGSASEPEAQSDPLAHLDRLASVGAGDPCADVATATPTVDPQSLMFPQTLSGDEDRPEVAATLAAAAAELEHPDPLPPGALVRPMVIPAAAGEYEDRIPAVLPAGVAAGGRADLLARTASHDPMLAEALPETSRLGETAAAGHDGEYTVQVISYDSPEGADAFAAGLRARGHRAFVMRAEVEGRGTVYRVRVGPFESMREANEYRRAFEASERMNVIVIHRRS